MKSGQLIIFYIIILLIQINSNPLSAQYYVSPSGADTNPGTLALPFKTIQKAASIMTAGDTCFIKAGTYRETIIPANNGTSSSPIVFINYQNDKVFIVGTEQINNWQVFNNGIYKAYAPDTVLQLCVNKEMANEARYPNFRGNHQSLSDWKTVNIDTNGKATFSGTNFPANYWKGGIVMTNVGSKWVGADGKIDSSMGNSVFCPLNRSYPWKSFPAYSPTVYTGSGLGYITNHLNALDTINEWFWQNDTLYYYPKNSGNISSMLVEARTRILGFKGDGKEYIEVHNLNFVWSSLSFESAKGCKFEGGSVFYPTPFYYFSNSWPRSSHDGNNYGISNWEGKGVAVSGNNNVIKNCYVAHSWGDGISVGGQQNTIENCLVEDCDWSATDCGVVAAIGKNHLITKNTLRTTGRSILVNRKCESTDITYNDMYDCGILTHDLGITYSYHSNGHGSEIAYNWVHDNHSPTSCMGIYLDNYDTAYIVHHNVIWNCTNAIQTNKPAVNHKIYNNTAWACTNAMGAWGNTGTTIQNQIVKNNLSNKAWNTGNTFSNNLVSTNPQFTNAATHDFTLLSGSPAIDYGTPITGITDGYQGNAPDAGAYEFGKTPWIPGSNISIPKITEIYIDSVQLHIGINTIENSLDGLKIFPNPTSNKVSIEYKNIVNSKLEIFDVFGKKILEKFNCTNIDLSSFEDGLYLFVISDQSNNTSTSQIVVLKK